MRRRKRSTHDAHAAARGPAVPVPVVPTAPMPRNALHSLGVPVLEKRVRSGALPGKLVATEAMAWETSEVRPCVHCGERVERDWQAAYVSEDEWVWQCEKVALCTARVLKAAQDAM